MDNLNFGKYFNFKNCHQIVVVLLILATNLTKALNQHLESPIPEVLLKPRNFNPHPFDQAYHNHHARQQSSINLNSIDSEYVDHSVYNIDVENSLPARHPSNGIYSQAPHQFPPTLPPGQNPRNFGRPYAPLKYNHANRQNENHHINYENHHLNHENHHLNEEDHLLNHENHHLNQENHHLNHENLHLNHDSHLINHENHHLNEIAVDEGLLSIPKKQYAFSYTVRDMHSGDDFSHTQQQKNGAVKGTYKVQLPDGRTQVVRYIADNDGYRADVSYLNDKNAVNHQGHAPGGYDGYLHDKPEQRHYHELNSHNSIYESNYIPSGPAPIPTASSAIFITTAQPPIDIHSHSEGGYGSNPLSIEQRKSISAKPTYVVSPKSTHINDAIRFAPNTASIEDNPIAIHQNHPNHPYYKPAVQHYSVFHQAR